MNDEPVLIGLIFADRIITEENRKKGIIGTFNRFIAKQFPATFPPWGIYAAITSIEGKHDFALNLVVDDTNQVILPISGGFQSSTRQEMVELTPMIGGAVFPRPGTYSLTFDVDGQRIGSRVLYVEQPEQAGG